MKKHNVSLADVQKVYSGPEAALWELIMGEQIHAGGMVSSTQLANSAGLGEGMKGLDLCCCLGAGMRFLARNYKVRMCGVDATEAVLAKARERAEAEGLGGALEFKNGDVMDIPYADGTFDFVWGEDAWCYVLDKEQLIKEAARVLASGGIIAFTDWIEGTKGLSNDEAERINTFMKFPYMESTEGYISLLKKHGFEITEAVEIEFGRYVDLYMTMLTEQLTFDALNILGNDMELFQQIGAEMSYMQSRIHDGKMSRGRFVARKK